MAHFARIENGIVREVLVIANNECLDENGDESEAVGQAFIVACGIAGDWVQTSYNGKMRGKYAGIGDRYDAELNEFVSPNVEEPA